MSRRKSVCSRWTLVILVVSLIPFVFTRPQDNSLPVSSTNSAIEKVTENSIRYRYTHNISLDRFKSPITKNDVDNFSHIDNSYFNILIDSARVRNASPSNAKENRNVTDRYSSRTSRLIKKRGKTKNKVLPIKNRVNGVKVNEKILPPPLPEHKKNSGIRKVITKWTDRAEDLDFSYDSSTSKETEDTIAFTNSLAVEEYTSIENLGEKVTDNSDEYPTPTNINKISTKIKNKFRYRPSSYYPEGNLVHSNKVHIIDQYPFPSAGPTFVFTSPRPTPIITNVGTPAPWPQPNYQNTHRRPTTSKPVRVTKPIKLQHNIPSSIDSYPQSSNNNFEVNTFQPAHAYTERIVIRPEEYSASSDDCPTVYLTLNNTFQGQAKEACPDLNIAVNTNVINKNVVVESEEGEGVDDLFPDGFGLPLEDESVSEEGNANDYSESEESQEQPESASVEATEFSNYHANSGIQAESPENVGSASHHHNAAISKPGKPGGNKDDDFFSISSIMDYFRPALNGMSWLAAINPLSFSVVSLILTPLALILAAFSAVAAIFAPLTYAREAPKEVHVYRPQWEWDDEHKTWHLNTLPNDRRWQPNGYHRYSKELETGTDNFAKPTLFYRIKEWMKSVTNKLRAKGSNKSSLTDVRRNKRIKRETWTKRLKNGTTTSENSKKTDEVTTSVSSTPNTPRNVKNKVPVIGDSIKMVTTQLLDDPANSTVEAPIVTDTRIPPKLKPQVQKHKIKTRQEDSDEPNENSHAGIAVPVTMEQLEEENKIVTTSKESSTSTEGISTWILLSNPADKENATTEASKIEELQKKQKPNPNKNKTKRPSNNKVPAGKRPIIGSTNKSDLVAGGSAINENVYNKIKDTVLSNVQKNKNTPTQRTTTTTSTTTLPPITETLALKKEVTSKIPSSIVPVAKVTSKPTKKKNKNKQKITTTAPTTVNESALLPMEPKEQEIELEVSTPATTTKKPKRSSTRKKIKTKKRKNKPKPDSATTVSNVKTNKTKTTKTKKPTSLTAPITSQIYSYFSREVMPSAVGVGVLGLASLVGLAGYFLYPFATPVRRTFEVDKKDDLYRHNAEEYASEGNGQAEEEMLGTVLAGMPAHSKQKLNPYSGQTTAHVSRYPVKKEQDIRYRQVANKYEPNYNVHYPQQKTGLAHGAVYSHPMNYNPYPYETRHAYTAEIKYTPDKGSAAYLPQPQPAVEPIYSAPQTGPSAVSSYGNDASNSVVYGVKPSSDTDFKPVYPYDGQYYSETTNSPMTYPPTSMYLGSNDDNENQTEEKYEENQDNNESGADNKFVVGNVPKEFSENVTPAVVPEHGPRKLKRRKRNIAGKIEEVLKAEKAKHQDVFISNEIDEALGHISMTEIAPKSEVAKVTEVKDVFPVHSVSMEPLKEYKTTTDIPTTTPTPKTVIVESVSTLPIDGQKHERKTTESELFNELETTTKSFKVYEVFSNPTEQSSPLIKSQTFIPSTTTEFKNMNTETTTELTSETTSTIPPSPTQFIDPKSPTTGTGVTTSNPEVLTYPPLNQESGFFTFLKRLIEFKYRLGLSLLQTTSDNLNRYLRSMDETVSKMAQASKT